MKICIGSKILDVQNDKALGFVVTSAGKLVAKGSRRYEIAVSEFKRTSEDNAYAAREALMKA